MGQGKEKGIKKVFKKLRTNLCGADTSKHPSSATQQSDLEAEDRSLLSARPIRQQLSSNREEHHSIVQGAQPNRDALYQTGDRSRHRHISDLNRVTYTWPYNRNAIESWVRGLPHSTASQRPSIAHSRELIEHNRPHQQSRIPPTHLAPRQSTRSPIVVERYVSQQRRILETVSTVPSSENTRQRPSHRSLLSSFPEPSNEQWLRRIIRWIEGVRPPSEALPEQQEYVNDLAMQEQRLHQQYLMQQWWQQLNWNFQCIQYMQQAHLGRMMQQEMLVQDELLAAEFEAMENVEAENQEERQAGSDLSGETARVNAEIINLGQPHESVRP